MSFAIIIPAQEKNRYHEQGDLAPFGQTTLLEWKIAQCKEFVDLSQINICSDSEIMKEIDQKEGINHIKRKAGLNYKEMLFKSVEAINVKDIILINTTSPFIGSKIYKDMYNDYKSKKLNSLISVEKKKEYIFFDEKNEHTKQFPQQYVSELTTKIVEDIFEGHVPMLPNFYQSEKLHIPLIEALAGFFNKKVGTPKSFVPLT